MVLLCNVLFQVEHKHTLIQEAMRVLSPNGRIVVVDWTDSHFGLGPEPERIISRLETEKLIISQGLEVEKDFDAGDHHYGLICRIT